MEIIFSHIEDSSQLYVAKKIDSLSNINIKSILSIKEVEYFNTITAVRRQIEYISIRKLLKQLVPNNISQIQYTKTGKPYLSDRKISISHSRRYIAIMISESFEVAVDIEEYRDNIHTASKKFLHKNESEKYSSTEDLTLLWSTKEALYKLYEASPDFKNNYCINEIKDELVLARVSTDNFDKATNLMYIRSKEYCLVWCSST